jgi:hypothetical protein
MFDERLNAPASRWISVLFLHGDDADEVLTMIDRSGAAATIKHLQSWDFGDKTTDAALTNGYVYDRIPAGATDRTIEDDGSPYALTYSAQFRYVSLFRRYSLEPDPEFVSAGRALGTQPARARRTADTWVATPGLSTNKAGRAVAL